MTVQDVFNIAYSRNKRARQGETATEAELIETLYEAMGRYFALGQLINLDWFTVEEPITYDATRRGWPRPSNAESVHRIEMPNGDEVAKVPFDDRAAERYKPALYRTNQVYRIAEHERRRVPNPIDTTTTLTFFYCRRPRAIESATAELDPMWPEGHETLLALELCIFLAAKENRHQDVPTFEAALLKSAMWFSSFMAHEDQGTTYPKSRVRKWALGRAEVGE